ncbi:MAG TPA: hypothetical protein DCS93_07390 [Microscillaceae bacterium]|nr:hypothetical protein [Microscillaceae bacterium]
MTHKIYLLTITLGLVSFLTQAQTLQGWITIHQDATKPIYEILVKDKDELNSAVNPDKQSQQPPHLIWAAFVQLTQEGRQIASAATNNSGKFTLQDIPVGNYTLKVFTYVELSFDLYTTINPSTQIIEIRVNSNAFKTYFYNLQLKDVPYTQAKAREDIAKGIIQLVELRSFHRTYCWPLPYEYIKVVEKKYGFRKVFKLYKVGQVFLDEAQKAYNNEVYAYLDKRHKINSKKLIREAFKKSYAKYLKKEFTRGKEKD